MKPVKILLVTIMLLLQSCYFHEPFDGTLLDSKYISVFNESLAQVVFDNIAISSVGYFSESTLNKFYYISQISDTICDRKMSLIHDWEGSTILSSQIDTTYYTTEKYEEFYLIKWEIDEGGVIESAKRYNPDGILQSSESYIFEVNPDIYDPNITTWLCPSARILEKRKHDHKGRIISKTIFTYNDDGTYETKIIIPTRQYIETDN